MAKASVDKLTGKPPGDDDTVLTISPATTATGKKFTVWCPQDKCLPAREIEADSPAEAKEKYMEEMGIITVGHPLSTSEIE